MTTQRNSAPSLSDDSPVLPASDQTASAESHAQEVAALQQELETLRAAHEQELARLRAEMAAEVGSLRAAVTATVEPSIASSDTLSEAAHADTTTTRRNLLRWGGIGAAAAIAAAGGASLASPTARAADGANLVLGNSGNTAEHITTLTYDGLETGPTVLQVSTTANDSTAIHASAGNGVSTSGAFGIYGTAGSGISAFGIFGQGGTDANGVYGTATGANSYAVWGSSDSGIGVVGSSGTGIDLAALGGGRLFQQTTSSTGAPTTGAYEIGEQIRDQLGNLYICVASGSPGTWKKVSSLSTSYKGGAIGFLSTPIRVYDSRKTGGALIGNATRDVHVTGVSIGGVQVPVGATGCVGNLTVTGPTASGYVVIYPQGSSTPTTSTVNFLSGQTVANAFAVGLSASGFVTVHSFTSGQCHFIVDITGFVS